MGLGLLIIISQISLAQLYNFKRYSIEEELPRSGVYSLCEDSKGFIWISTEGGGVSVFDGETFMTYTMENGLAYNIVRITFEDEQGFMWFGTQGKGVSRFDGREFITYDSSHGLPHDDIRAIAQDNRGNIWLGTFGGGLCRLSLDKDNPTKYSIDTFTTQEGIAHDRIRTILKDSKGRMWIGTDGGATVFNGLSFQSYTHNNGLPHNRVLTIFEDGVKNLWFGTPEGVARFNGQRFTIYTVADGLIHNRVRAVAQGQHGNFWFGTKDGVSRFDGNDFVSFTEQQGLSNNRIRSILLDSLGNLWFGTFFGGINKYSGDDFVHYTENDGLLNNQVISLLSDNKGSIWLGTFEGINHMVLSGESVQQVSNITEQNGLINSIVRCIFQDQNGTFWFGTEGGLSIYDRRQFINITTAEGLPGDNIRQIIQQSPDTFWIGTDMGLARITIRSLRPLDYSIMTYGQKDGLAGTDVSALHKDFRDNLWIGFDDGGISVYNGTDFINRPPSLPALQRICAIISNPQGELWIATEGQGIFRYIPDDRTINLGALRQYSMEQGLTSNNIYQLIFDDAGNLWAGTEKGINRIEPEFAAIKHFGREEGFIGIETNENAVCRDLNGRIWFGTIKGVTCYNPYSSSINKTEPYTHLTGVKIFSGSNELDPNAYASGYSGRFSMPQDLTLPYNINNIAFDFIGISMKIPSKVRYSWKLEGFDPDWSSPVPKHEAKYTNLPPGTYTFRVKASNDDGIWNQAFSSFSFRIAPPFWKTLWFILMCIAVGIGGFILYIKIRERRLIKEKKILTEKVEQRTAEINKQKEELAVEKIKSDDLLLNILPREAAEELKLKGWASTKHYDMVSVLFTDFVNFTTITEQVSHDKLIAELNRYFIRFDEIIENYNIEKIKTIGDSYMCAGGLRILHKNSAVATVLAGLEFQRFMKDANVSKKMNGENEWHLRLGINTGKVIAGVVGKKKFTYDIWGDTVNIASRMESGGGVGKVNISGTTYELVKDYFICSHRGKIQAKNKGEVDMYFVEKIKPEFSMEDDGIFPNDAFIAKYKARA